MDALPVDPFEFVGGMIAISLIVPLVTTVLVDRRRRLGDPAHRTRQRRPRRG